ncbi:alpha-L-fucosidase [Algibacter lectus]|uniref:alpha-L-fucosidase n=1 Tax=Algibacter lectus TaxID=221126 RepID=A0A090X0J1_9FLAO|nr:alpha-L-fucosidase [Algibacter lectus]GAL82048.1 alpha-L-fucosidase [Algibacter lectus]
MKRITYLYCAAFCLLMACQKNKSKDTNTKEYESNWESISQYECPEWFQDAKFGIWAVNSPMEVAEFGDWYALKMYQEGSDAYKYHCEKFGHPSQFGYKDLIPQWTLDHLDTDKMAALFAKSGAKYLVTLASHHDGFDTYNSKFQPWNAVNMGPKFDLLGNWAKSARANGMKFGASVHAINSWGGWNRNAFLSDTIGKYRGIPYDANQTKADGKSKWWDGYDPPQDLYGPIEKLSDTFPTLKYIKNWYNRQIQLVDDYKPDLLYYDAYIMKPVWRQFVYFGDQTYDAVTPPEFKKIAEKTPYKEAGIDVLSYYYNQSKKWTGKDDQLVFNLKVHDLGDHVPDNYKKGMVIDRELGGFGGAEKEMQKHPWQKDMPFGDWQYNPNIVYPETKEIVWSLVDIVSKNGNLLLGMPMRPNALTTIDNTNFLKKWVIGYM